MCCFRGWIAWGMLSLVCLVGRFVSVNPGSPVIRAVNPHFQHRRNYIHRDERVCMVSNHRRQAFWEKVDRGDSGDCWEWQGGTRRGYGMFWNGERTVNAHRFAYLLDRDHQAEDFVLHDCDNSLCCNPNHLHNGTQSDNVEEWYDRQDASKLFEGETNPNATLTESDVREIKRRLEEETQAKLAEEYGVNPPAISHIANGVTWEGVEP